ncbi:7356_t:CDS:1, partial [Scutellospora calospora]
IINLNIINNEITKNIQENEVETIENNNYNSLNVINKFLKNFKEEIEKEYEEEIKTIEEEIEEKVEEEIFENNEIEERNKTVITQNTTENSYNSSEELDSSTSQYQLEETLTKNLNF